MKNSERDRIRAKIKSIDRERWWGDDFDSRFYLISKSHDIKNKKILDLGGGIGIISSELDDSNFRINLDLKLDDLKICKKKTDPNIDNICASMTNLPFVEESFDYIICSHILEVAKQIDVERLTKKNRFDLQYPTVEITLDEIQRVLKMKGSLFLTTPNNEYYRSIKLTYSELKQSLSNHFTNFSIKFYNTFPKISKKYRKLNMANTIPKLLTQLIGPDKVIQNLLTDKTKNNYSVSFFVEATKQEK